MNLYLLRIQAANWLRSLSQKLQEIADKLRTEDKESE